MSRLHCILLKIFAICQDHSFSILLNFFSFSFCNYFVTINFATCAIFFVGCCNMANIQFLLRPLLFTLHINIRIRNYILFEFTRNFRLNVQNGLIFKENFVQYNLKHCPSQEKFTVFLVLYYRTLSCGKQQCRHVYLSHLSSLICKCLPALSGFCIFSLKTLIKIQYNKISKEFITIVYELKSLESYRKNCVIF